MEEKRNCKIVQDLLPNYIEKLTNEETNNFIEEHLRECAECQKIFENMKKDIQVKNTKRDDREVKYIKKYNSKLKLLRNILLIIIILFVIIIGRKVIILTNLSNKAQEIQNNQNYYSKIESYKQGEMKIIEIYKKQDKILMTWTSYSQDADKIKQVFYKSGEEKIALIDNGKTKRLSKVQDISANPIVFTSNIFWINLYTAITTDIDKVNLNGKECYIVKDNNTEKFIDVKSGIAVKEIDNEINMTADYEYKFGVVNDSDVARPDTTGYTINE